jgi:L-ascorbate metabolism protein UlaG (beta-lactamase superfamily)
MNATEAAQLVNYLQPKTAIPVGYGSVIGTQQDAEAFKSLVEKVQVILL